MELQIEITADNPAWASAVPDAAAIAERAARAALAEVRARAPAALGAASACELGITLTDDRHIAVLNRDWRGQDRPTNVLSFPIGEAGEAGEADGPAPRLLGDVVVALETLLAEAAAEAMSPTAHLSHLVVHGVLHLLGYDHEVTAEAEAMEALERDVLAGLGIADPYREQEAAETGR